MEDAKKALELIDLDYTVVVGELSDPETYRRLKVEKATMVVANINDMMNTNIAFTVREVSKEVPIVANADLDDSVDILQLAEAPAMRTTLVGKMLQNKDFFKEAGPMESGINFARDAARVPCIFW